MREYLVEGTFNRTKGYLKKDTCSKPYASHVVSMRVDSRFHSECFPAQPYKISHLRMDFRARIAHILNHGTSIAAISDRLSEDLGNGSQRTFLANVLKPDTSNLWLLTLQEDFGAHIFKPNKSEASINSNGQSAYDDGKMRKSALETSNFVLKGLQEQVRVCWLFFTGTRTTVCWTIFVCFAISAQFLLTNQSLPDMFLLRNACTILLTGQSWLDMFLLFNACRFPWIS